MVVSSVAAVMLNPNRPKSQALDEECWSGKGFCKATEVSNEQNFICFHIMDLETEFLKLFPELLSPGENNSRDSSFGVC